jgi:hypothetical protein
MIFASWNSVTRDAFYTTKYRQKKLTAESPVEMYVLSLDTGYFAKVY